MAIDSKALSDMCNIDSTELAHMIIASNAMDFSNGQPASLQGDSGKLMSQAPDTAPLSRPPARKTARGKPVSSPSQTSPQVVSDVWTEIVEQPKSGALRFRYECEGRSAGSTPGVRSTNDKKTYPSIKIHNYKGVAVIVVSCVTKDNPPRPHPHSLVGKDCKMGVCTLKVKDTDFITFPHLGIQCVKKKDVEEALKMRKEINVDPYQTGFDTKASNIDFSVVKLCFQVFLPDDNGKITRIVSPISSQPIHDKKAFKDLIICRVDKTSGKARGGDEIFLLCEKINKDDIQIRFFQDTAEGTLWEDYGEFGAGDVHRQFAVVFKTPAYRDAFIPRPIQVQLQLKRPSDGETSDPIQFTYMPEDPDPDRIAEKKKRKAESLERFVRDYEATDRSRLQPGAVKDNLRQKLKAQRTIKQESPELPAYSFNNTGGTAPKKTAPATATNNMGSNVFSCKTADNSNFSNIIVSNPVPQTQSMLQLLNNVSESTATSQTQNVNTNSTFVNLTSANLQSIIEGAVKSDGSNPSSAPQLMFSAGNNTVDVTSGLSSEINLSLGSDSQHMFSISSQDLQNYLSENGAVLSFGSADFGSGMQVEYEQGVAAVENVSSDVTESNTNQMNSELIEALKAMQGDRK